MERTKRLEFVGYVSDQQESGALKDSIRLSFEWLSIIENNWMGKQTL